MAFICVPTLICMLPLLMVFAFNQAKSVQSSTTFNLFVNILPVLIGILTPVLSCIAGAKILAISMPGDQAKCLTGAAIFFPVGCVFSIGAILLSIYFMIRNLNKKAKSISNFKSA